MTKAASYLLWRDNFSTIRDYLLDNMEFMVSDSTGIPPKFATKAGFVQEAYGKFNESFLGASAELQQGLREAVEGRQAPFFPVRLPGQRTEQAHAHHQEGAGGEVGCRPCC